MSRALWLLLLGLALTAVASFFDLAPLYVPGVGFTALALAAPAWVELSARRVRVTRELPAVHVIEQEPVELRLRVSAGKLSCRCRRRRSRTRCSTCRCDCRPAAVRARSPSSRASHAAAAAG